jgi:hypothetical protein
MKWLDENFSKNKYLGIWFLKNILYIFAMLENELIY